MPEHSGQVGVSCADCYFRQELLCALRVDKVCTTFRQTVRSADKPIRDQPADEVIPQPGVVHMVTAVPSTAQAEVAVADSSITDQPRRAAAASRNDMRGVGIEVMIDEYQLSLGEPDAPVRGGRITTGGTITAWADERRSRVASRVAERYPRALQGCS